MRGIRGSLPVAAIALLLLLVLGGGAARAQTSHPHVQTLERFFSAMNSGDADTALTLVTDRIALEGAACSIGIESCAGIEAVEPIIRAAAEAAALGVSFSDEIVSAEVRGDQVTGVVHERAPDGFVAVDRIVLFLEADFRDARIMRLRLTPDLRDPQTAAADFVAKNFSATLDFFNIALSVFGRLLDGLNAGDVPTAIEELSPEVALQGALCGISACEGHGVARLILRDWSARGLEVNANIRLLVNHRAGVGVTGLMEDADGARFRFEAEVVGRRIVRFLLERLPGAQPALLPASGSGGLAASGGDPLPAALVASAVVVTVGGIALGRRRRSN